MKNSINNYDSLSEPFKALLGNQFLHYKILDMLPTPIEVFAPDGMCIFCNQACMELSGITDANAIVGNYNLKNDTACLGIIGQGVMDRIFRGEACSLPDFPAPLQDLVDRGVISEKPYESLTMDVFVQPVWDGSVFVCTICYFTVKHIYYGKPEVAKARKYIDEHWHCVYDEHAIAEAANVSASHLRMLFRQDMSETMYDYYLIVRITHIKEMLANKNLTIAEAFSFCGADNRGNDGVVFKKLTGMTPSEYRNSLQKAGAANTQH